MLGKSLCLGFDLTLVVGARCCSTKMGPEEADWTADVGRATGMELLGFSQLLQLVTKNGDGGRTERKW